MAGLISGAYFVYFWTRTGATPGQSFLGLEVRNAAAAILDHTTLADVLARSRRLSAARRRAAR